jgi:hypothetical protein
LKLLMLMLFFVTFDFIGHILVFGISWAFSGPCQYASNVAGLLPLLGALMVLAFSYGSVLASNVGSIKLPAPTHSGMGMAITS